MLSRVIAVFGRFTAINSQKYAKYAFIRDFIIKPMFSFSKSKGFTAAQIPPESIKIKASSITLGQQEIDYYKTEGSISIIQKIPGCESESGQLYALKFKCSTCKAQSIRSFTKKSYHKGVVMVRCRSCQKMHLVADNLGWFQDQPSSYDKIDAGQAKKGHDPVAVVRFLQQVLGQGDKDGNKEKQQQRQIK